MKVQNRVIVVTGGGSGMGRELTLNLLSKNAKVIAIDINQNGLQETVSLAGANKNNLCTFVVDITSKVAVEALFEKAIIQFGFVSASVGVRASFESPTPPLVRAADFYDKNKSI